eukprot:6528876-Alexandrium_andersonii.AAC.1
MGSPPPVAMDSFAEARQSQQGWLSPATFAPCKALEFRAVDNHVLSGALSCHTGLGGSSFCPDLGLNWRFQKVSSAAHSGTSRRAPAELISHYGRLGRPHPSSEGGGAWG